MPPPTDLHLVPREEPESTPGVVKMPPRPSPPLTAEALTSAVGTVVARVDTLQRDLDRTAQDGVNAILGLKVAVEETRVDVDSVKVCLMREVIPKLDYGRAARDEVRALADVVGKAPDLAALAHASQTDLSPEHVERLDREAKLGTGLFKAVSELRIQVGKLDRRAFIGAGLGAALTTHGPDLVVAAASLGWPGIVALVVLVAVACVAAAVRRRKVS